MFKSGPNLKLQLPYVWSLLLIKSACVMPFRIFFILCVAVSSNSCLSSNLKQKY
jgi:hypothetical protein